jgi:hypothetical protein
MKVSTCCQAEAENEDYEICPECLEHCDFEDYDSDDDEIFNNFNHEGGIKYNK